MKKIYSLRAKRSGNLQREEIVLISQGKIDENELSVLKAPSIHLNNATNLQKAPFYFLLIYNNKNYLIEEVDYDQLLNLGARDLTHKDFR